jgi:hypothetical protein
VKSGFYDEYKSGELYVFEVNDSTKDVMASHSLLATSITRKKNPKSGIHFSDRYGTRERRTMITGKMQTVTVQ